MKLCGCEDSGWAKAFPQGLKPSCEVRLTARLKVVPSHSVEKVVPSHCVQKVVPSHGVRKVLPSHSVEKVVVTRTLKRVLFGALRHGLKLRPSATVREQVVARSLKVGLALIWMGRLKNGSRAAWFELG